MFNSGLIQLWARDSGGPYGKVLNLGSEVLLCLLTCLGDRWWWWVGGWVVVCRVAGPHADIFLWSVKQQVDFGENWIVNDDYTLRYTAVNRMQAALCALVCACRVIVVTHLCVRPLLLLPFLFFSPVEHRITRRKWDEVFPLISGSWLDRCVCLSYLSISLSVCVCARALARCIRNAHCM